MKLSELAEGIKKACGGRNPAECLMRVGYVVNDPDVEWTVEDLDIDGPYDVDRDGAPLGRTADVTVHFAIEDFNAEWPYAGLARTGSGKPCVKYTLKWDKALAVTAADALAEIDGLLASGADNEIFGFSEDGKAAPRGGVSSVTPRTLDKPGGFRTADGVKKFSALVVVWDSNDRDSASDADVRQYVEDYEDDVREQAYEQYDRYGSDADAEREHWEDLTARAAREERFDEDDQSGVGGAVKVGMRPRELLSALGYDWTSNDGAAFDDALAAYFKEAHCADPESESRKIEYSGTKDDDDPADIWVSTPIVGYWSNNGIGAYEYWGSQEYDAGTDYVEFDDMSFDEHKFALAADKIGFDVVTHEEADDFNNTDTSEFEDWDEEDDIDPHYRHQGKAYGTGTYPYQLTVSDPAKAEAFARSAIQKAPGVLNESLPGVQFWAHMLDEAMEAK